MTKVIIEVNGNTHWTVAGVTRDGTNCIGSSAPEAELGGGGGGGWEGVKLTPPTGFESGQYGGGSGSDPREMTYTVKLLYLGNENGCTCSGFHVRGRYVHTYDGSVDFGWSNSVSIGVSYPWGVSLGGEFTFTNDHAWTRQLVDPTGSEHVKSLFPPSDFVPREDCCDAKSVSRPSIRIDPPVCVPTPDPTRYIVTTVLYPASAQFESSQTVEMIARSPQGFEIGRLTKEFVSSGDEAVEVVFELEVPPHYGESSFLVELIAIDENGSLDTASGAADASVGPSAPLLTTDLMGSDALVLGDALGAGLRDPFASAEQAASKTTAIVFNARGEAVDAEPAVWSGDEVVPAKWGTVPGHGDAIAGDGLLSVERGDTVAVEYRSEFGVIGSTIAVIRDPAALLDCVAVQAPGGPTAISGVSGGSTLVFEIQPAGGSCRLVEIPTFAGMSAAKVTTAFIRAMRGHGVRCTIDADGYVRIANPGAWIRCRPVSLDAGLDLYGRE